MRPRPKRAAPFGPRTWHCVGPGRLGTRGPRAVFSPLHGEPVAVRTGRLDLVCCYGTVHLSAAALYRFCQAGTPIALFSADGRRVRGRLLPERPGPSAAGLRDRQFAALADPDRRRELARRFVLDKLAAQGTAARELQKRGKPGATAALHRLRNAWRRANAVDSVNALRGVEGGAAAIWFRLLAATLRPGWSFAKRVRRPPRGPVNALLSLAGTLVVERAAAAAAARGLEVDRGCLHENRPGRPSLACDLAEPLRADAVGRWTLAVCNQGRLSPADFEEHPSHGTRLKPDCFPVALADWETHWAVHDLRERLNGVVTEFVAALGRRSGGPGAGVSP
ncbi:CRISPR-associated endonuclease Cas1 [Alienimonas californiensis]|uniref:CRISPR-associated endonuclease Cas1 n=1 Tax=Alienimonas californiensis TaxID=2527989 RepID=A0A517P6R2_9PLAN|nr:CRISPR-associated endonuclease Cas1 [Alienimonas californiensis]